MAHDKITVDEPLISTDVDSLIHTLSDKKRVSLDDLRQTCKIDKKTLEKWLAVLEDEGYINVEYGIRGTFINWIGLGVENTSDGYVVDTATTIDPEPDSVIVQAEKTPKQEVPKEAPQEVQSNQHVDIKPVDDKPVVADTTDFDYSDAVQDIDSNDDTSPEPEELLSEYLARRKEKGSIDVAELRATILNKLDKDDVKEVDDVAGDIKSDESQEPVAADEPIAQVIDEEPEVEGLAGDEDDGGEPTPIQEPNTIVKEQAAIRELMSSYLSEINREKEEIEKLKRQKETVYNDTFSTIEGRMQSDVAVLSEKIIERQSRIAELKEKVLELPDKVDDLNKMQREMDKLKKEGRAALERTKTKADNFITNLNNSKSGIEERIGAVTGVMETQSGKVRDFEELSTSLDSKIADLKAAMESSQAQVDEIMGNMETLKADLSTVEQMKTDIASMTDAIKTTVAGCGEELSALEAELEGIAKMEHWVQEYIRDYEGKVAEIEDYVSHSDDELAELKTAAESIYMKDYLTQLETLTEDYQNALYNAVSREQDIDQKIADSKARITELVKESQEVIKKAKSGIVLGSSEYNSLLARVKQRTSKIKAVVTEKQGERSKLSEDAKSTRKTMVAPKEKAPVKTKAKAKVSKPKKKRK